MQKKDPWLWEAVSQEVFEGEYSLPMWKVNLESRGPYHPAHELIKFGLVTTRDDS